ncbi:hypothetical protein FA95DRAFT_1563059 [Auriscalpium vulgare]|uniref:Uncharacterized protein n=1 Tax=Auriscalpium vulgare TaxID=40419 RepID=A0ACB8RIS3_9AGAM|nr:hypothetical protein FA95DRAFT_1563059 [Auriscalpium vulgare]
MSPRSVDAAFEFSKIRQALSLLESHVVYIQRGAGPSSAALPRASSYSHPISTAGASVTALLAKQELVDNDMLDEDAPGPGAHGRSDHGGFYAGPTSAVSHLSSAQEPEGTPDSETVVNEPPWDTRPGYEDDNDLLHDLPHASIVDGLVEFYFEYCTWVYRHVNQRSFTAAWARYKSGAGADRIVLATVCMVMAIALHYLPADHELLRGLQPDIEELGTRFYNIMRVALQRRQAESRTYSLELVELLLVRCHYLTLSKIDSEEIWSVKGELMMVATAMGLHRDPGKRKMSLEVAERRRWAWWHVILLERWQAFMFGRPLAIASHHFDTHLPSYVDPDIDPSGRLYDANIALFRLAYILGDIMDDAISLRTVPYDSVMAKDQLLQEWWDTLPAEIDIDDYNLVRSLASPETAIRRLGVQSIIVRAAFLHIRFTMHRPYASVVRDQPKMVYSLDAAVNAADKLVALSAQAHPELRNNAALSVPGHLNWGPFHCFSAAMFFSFQLINDPDQPGARMFRKNVLRAVNTLEHCRGMPVADKALAILKALGPLYTESFISDMPEARERKKAAVLPMVRSLQFPYHDSPSVPLGAPESPRNGALSSPGQSSGHTGSPSAVGLTPTPPKAPLTLPAGPMQLQHQHMQQQPPMMALQPPSGPMQQSASSYYKTLPSLQWAPVQTMSSQAMHPQNSSFTSSSRTTPPHQQFASSGSNGTIASHSSQTSLTSPVASHGMGWSQPTMPPPPPPQVPSMSHRLPQSQQQMTYGSAQPLPQHSHPQHEMYMDGGAQDGLGAGALWGAASGFVQGEWDQIFDDLHRGDGGGAHGRPVHLPPPSTDGGGRRAHHGTMSSIAG